MNAKSLHSNRGRGTATSRPANRCAQVRCGLSALVNPDETKRVNMDEFWTRVVQHMAGRVTGPMKLRLLQPGMASIFAIHSVLADARGRKPV